jgi:hypothetical protein
VRELAVQRRPGGADQEAIQFELLLAFTRALIHNIGSRDIIFLSLLAAQKETGASLEMVTRLEKAVTQEYKAGTIWPPGFF